MLQLSQERTYCIQMLGKGWGQRETRAKGMEMIWKGESCQPGTRTMSSQALTMLRIWLLSTVLTRSQNMIGFSTPAPLPTSVQHATLLLSITVKYMPKVPWETNRTMGKWVIGTFGALRIRLGQEGTEGLG